MTDEAEDSAEEQDFKPLTADQARQWRQTQTVVSPWKILWWQCLAGSVVVACAALWGGQGWAGSAAYGAFAVLFPAALMARGLQRQRGVTQGGAVMFGFVLWELVKIVVTVALLLAAPRLISSVNWLALVLGFVVVMKVYWVAALVYARHPSRHRMN